MASFQTSGQSRATSHPWESYKLKPELSAVCDLHARRLTEGLLGSGSNHPSSSSGLEEPTENLVRIIQLMQTSLS